MSRQIPQDELNKKFSYRFKQWFFGDADTLVDVVESHPLKEAKDNTREMKRHQKDRIKMMERIHDTASNRTYKNFFRFYTVTAVCCCIALVNPGYKDSIKEKITGEYLEKFPQYKDTFSVHFCKSADGCK